jgi:DDE superfamily endonuclease
LIYVNDTSFQQDVWFSRHNIPKEARAMELVPSFLDWLQPLSLAMTTPTFQNFVRLTTGWVLAGRRTVTEMIVAADVVGVKHHSTFHRVFARAAWSLDTVGLIVFDLLTFWLGNVVFLALDDTLARKRGLKVFGAGMHHDPLLSTRKMAVLNWGHSWVVLGVVLKFPFRPDRVFCLPVLFRLYLNKQAAQRARRAYRTRPQLASEMITRLCSHAKTRRFHVVADSLYGGRNVLRTLPTNCDLTTRINLDARLYEPPPERLPGTSGRPRMRGKRIASPRQMLSARCRQVELTLYGRHDRVRLADIEARWHCVAHIPLRVVAVEPLSGGRTIQAFYSTCYQASAVEVLTWYAQRWSIEQTFQDSKTHLGFEQPQGWTRKAVERTAPVAMLLYSLIVLWFAERGHRYYSPRLQPWYPHKRGPSFADALATLRRQIMRQQVSAAGLSGPGSNKIKNLLQNTAAMAA